MEWLMALLRQIFNSLSVVLNKENQIINLQQTETNEISSLRSRLEDMDDRLKQQDKLLQLIVKQTAPPTTPFKMELQFQGEEIGMPGKESDTQTIPCSAIETDADGQPVQLNPASVTWAIDNPAIAALTQNPDGSATFKALSLGTANVTCTDNSVNPPVVGTDTLTVTAGPANKLVLQFGTAA